LDNSHCAVLNANTTTGALGATNLVVNATTEWMAIGNAEGYRTYWVVGGLLPSSNYTAYYLESTTGTLSQPIWFTTKQCTSQPLSTLLIAKCTASFPCQLVLPTPYCPSIGYSAPLEAKSTLVLSSPAPLTTLPESLITPLTQSLESFSTSLSSKACGRDYYSHTSSCLDCHTSYRDWICRNLIPRCIDPPTTSSDGITDQPEVIPPRSIPRSGGSYDYQQLLPCLGVCNRVDRTCPAWMGFECPQRGINANETYGFFGQDEERGDGAVDSSGGGVRSSDKWGNRWCNGP
jgi:calcium channel MID1